MRNDSAEPAPSILNLQGAKDQLKQVLETMTGLSDREKEQICGRLLDASGCVWKFLVPLWNDGRLLILGAGWHNSFLFLAPHFHETTVWDPDPERISVFRQTAGLVGLNLQFESGDLHALLDSAPELDLIVFEESLNPIASQTLVKAATALSERGECAISVRNRNFLRHLNRLVKGRARHGRDLWDRRRKIRNASLYRTIRSAQQAQLLHRQLYFLYPSQESPREIVGWGRKEPAETRHPFVRALSRVGAGKYFYSSSIVVAKRSAEQTSFVDQLLRHIRSELELPCLPEINRCAVSNGNTALFFLNLDHNHRAVLRVPLCQVGLRRTETERNMLKQAQEISSASVRRLLPKAVSYGTFCRQPYLLRSCVPGVDAKTSLTHRLDRLRLMSDAAEILLQWCQDFQEVIEVTPEVCQHYFLSHVVGARPYLPRHAEVLTQVEDCIKSLTIGQSLPLTFVHGDFHSGNLMVDPATKRLIGIIDWDLGEQHGLPMLDLFHLLASGVRNEQSWGIGRTFLSTLWPGTFQPEEQLLIERHRHLLRISDTLFSSLKLAYWARHCLGNLISAGGLKPPVWMQKNITEVLDALPRMLQDLPTPETLSDAEPAPESLTAPRLLSNRGAFRRPLD